MPIPSTPSRIRGGSMKFTFEGLKCREPTSPNAGERNSAPANESIFRSDRRENFCTYVQTSFTIRCHLDREGCKMHSIRSGSRAHRTADQILFKRRLPHCRIVKTAVYPTESKQRDF